MFWHFLRTGGMKWLNSGLVMDLADPSKSNWLHIPCIICRCLQSEAVKCVRFFLGRQSQRWHGCFCLETAPGEQNRREKQEWSARNKICQIGRTGAESQTRISYSACLVAWWNIYDITSCIPRTSSLDTGHTWPAYLMTHVRTYTILIYTDVVFSVWGKQGVQCLRFDALYTPTTNCSFT